MCCSNVGKGVLSLSEVLCSRDRRIARETIEGTPKGYFAIGHILIGDYTIRSYSIMVSL